VKKYCSIKLGATGQIEFFEEKPKQPFSTLIGIALYSYPKATLPLIKQYVAEGNNPDQPGRLIQWLYPRTPVYTWTVPGIWYDIGSKETLEEVAKQYFLAEAVIDRLSRLIDPAVLQALLVNPNIDLSNLAKAQHSAQLLMEVIGGNGVQLEPRYDEKGERYLLVIKRTQHGNLHQTALDAEFLHSGDFQQIKTTAHVLQGLLSGGAYVKRGEQKRQVTDVKEALNWLLDEVKKSLGIQRYKGLGEMNPSQLRETTMNPDTRRLVQLTVAENDETFEQMDRLLAKKRAGDRKSWLEDKGNLADL